MEILTAKKIVLILLRRAESSDKFMGITRIEKLVFLLTLRPEFKDIEKALKYEPLYYGPYSREIKNALDELKGSGFVVTKTHLFNKQQNNLNRRDEEITEQIDENNEFIETAEYSLTLKGQKVADRLFRDLKSQSHQDVIDDVVNKYSSLELKELLKSVYKIAPEELLARSTIRKELGC